MSRGFLAPLLLALSTWTGLSLHAQPASTQARAPQGAKTEHLEQLRTCREGVLDANARPEDRRRWIELLLSYDTAESRSLVGELLRAPTKPEILRAVCDVLRERGRESIRKIDESYVDPLVDLLESEVAQVRSSSARVLAGYSTPSVPARLGAIASDANAAMNKRLAAVDALAPNIHRREVVEQLVPLLDSGVPEIVTGVSVALEPGFPGTLASAPAERRAWLRQKLALSPEAWLEEQLDVYHERARRLQDELASFREEWKREQTALGTQVGSLQRELYRTLPPEQRAAKLNDWLASSLAMIQLNGAAIIKAAIADEGKRPEGDVLAAVLRLLQSPTPAVRREALFIAQALNDPAVVDAVLARVEAESDPGVRQALFSSIGKLETLQAVPLLLREVSDSHAPPECVREAALALGRIAAGATGAAIRRDCVAPLKLRYHGQPPNDASVRSALLTAMARVADPAFAQEFLEATESEDPGILQPAIQGLHAIRDATRLPRLRALVTHPDPSVRLATIEAIAELGREEFDLEALRLRLNTGVETSEIVREAAWKAFRELVARRPFAERIQAAERLRDTPELSARYLEELLEAAIATNAAAGEVLQVRDRLAAALVAIQRYPQAAPHLQKLYEAKETVPGNGALDYGTRWFDALLHGSTPKEVVEAALVLRRSASDRAVQAMMVDAFNRYVDSPAFLADRERARLLCTELRSGSGEDWIPAWPDAIARAVARLEALETSKTPVLP